MPVELSGKSVREKLDELNNMLRKEGADSLILAALDEVAWTFNIRGTDVAYNPVVISYAFVSEDESVLFIDPKKITAESAENLKKEGVILADYTMIQKYLCPASRKTAAYSSTRQKQIYHCTTPFPKVARSSKASLPPTT